MDLERYFEQSPGGERMLRGTRVPLAILVDAWLAGLSPEEIAYNYPTVGLEAVYASLTWYLANRPEADRAFEVERQWLAARAERHERSALATRLAAVAGGSARDAGSRG